MSPREFTPAAPTVPKPRLPRNDAYQGSVITGALRPRFVWEPSTAQRDPIVYELQFSPDPKLETDVTTVKTSELTYQPPEPLAVSTVPPVGRRYYWRVRACLEESCSEYSRPWWVNLGRSAKDLNGDGYADVAVWAPTSMPYGTVNIYFGGPAPFDVVADGVVRNPLFLQGIGPGVVGGDVNGDGYGDLLVRLYEPPRAWIYYGGPGRSFDINYDIELPRLTTPSLDAALYAGDVDLDGKTDVLLGSSSDGTRGALAGAFKIITQIDAPGGPSQVTLFGEKESEYVGLQPAGYGDVDGDGASDLLITPDIFRDEVHAPPCFTRLYRAGDLLDAVADEVIQGETTAGLCSFGAAIVDLDGDGMSDIVTGENAYQPGSSAPQLQRIRPYLSISAGSLSALPPLDNVIAREELSAIVPLGDVNRDGYDDFVASGNVANSVVILGSPAGAHVAGRLPGTFITSAGDVNADGSDDLLLYTYTPAASRLYLGGPGGAFNEVVDALFPGDTPAVRSSTWR